MVSKKKSRAVKRRMCAGGKGTRQSQPTAPAGPIIFHTKYDAQYLYNLRQRIMASEVPPLYHHHRYDDDSDSDDDCDLDDMLVDLDDDPFRDNSESEAEDATEDTDSEEDSDASDSEEDSDSYDDIENYGSDSEGEGEDDMNAMPKLIPRVKQRDTDDIQDVDDLLFLQRITAQMRNDRWHHERLDWPKHVAKLVHEGSFVNEYTMSIPTHGKLVRILDPILKRVEYNSRGDPIKVEHIVAAGLRVLSGGRVKDQKHIVGTSRTAAYDAVDDFIDAVNEAEELAIRFPSTVPEWQCVNAGFKRKSWNCIIPGCVGALDGFFQRTNKPSRSEVSNALAYYSGHYEHYGVNCQACIQSDLQFTYFGVVAPGSTNDNIAYATADGLREVIDNLPLTWYAVADAAYTLSERILIPFTGAERFDPFKDSFNYYLSQLRIRVEMAFGRLVNKFRILGRKIEGSLDRVTAILMACARLHNFIIKEDGPFEKAYISVEDEMKNLDIQPDPSAPLGMSYLPVVPDNEFVCYDGVSFTRQAIVDNLRKKQIYRPLHNIERKKREQSSVISCDGTVWDREYISPM